MLLLVVLVRRVSRVSRHFAAHSVLFLSPFGPVARRPFLLLPSSVADLSRSVLFAAPFGARPSLSRRSRAFFRWFLTFILSFGIAHMWLEVEDDAPICIPMIDIHHFRVIRSCRTHFRQFLDRPAESAIIVDRYAFAIRYR